MKTKLCEVRHKGQRFALRRDQRTAIALVGTEAIRLQTYTFHDVEVEVVFLVMLEENPGESDAWRSVVSVHKTYDTAEAWMFEARAARRRNRKAYRDVEWSVEIEELKP